VFNWAALNGHLDVVKFLHCNRTEGCTTNAMNLAVENGRLDVVEFLTSIQN
jgi:ankyrin repeat protein